jgi:hypothetical protein
MQKQVIVSDFRNRERQSCPFFQLDTIKYMRIGEWMYSSTHM